MAVKDMSIFEKRKFALVMAEALEAHGINPEATDLKAAIGEALSKSTDAAAIAKAAKWDKLASQAKELSIDADALVATDDGFVEHVDSAARKLLKENLGNNAPPPAGSTEPPAPFSAEGLTGPQLAAEYKRLVAAEDHDGASAFFAKYSTKFLAHLNPSEG